MTRKRRIGGIKNVGNELRNSGITKTIMTSLIVFPMAPMSVVTFQFFVCRSKDELINMVI